MGEEMNVLENERVEDVDAVTTEEQTGAQEHEEGNESNQEQESEKKYTDDDLDKIIARKIAAERKRMSKLFNEEQQENEMEIRERKVLERELKADAKDALIAQGLPSSLSNLMTYNSKEEYDKSFEDVSAVFREAMRQEYTNRFSQSPKASSMGSKEINREKALHAAFAPKHDMR